MVLKQSSPNYRLVSTVAPLQCRACVSTCSSTSAVHVQRLRQCRCLCACACACVYCTWQPPPLAMCCSALQHLEMVQRSIVLLQYIYLHMHKPHPPTHCIQLQRHLGAACGTCCAAGGSEAILQPAVRHRPPRQESCVVCGAPRCPPAHAPACPRDHVAAGLQPTLQVRLILLRWASLLSAAALVLGGLVAVGGERHGGESASLAAAATAAR